MFHINFNSQKRASVVSLFASMNPYMQFFTGETKFTHRFPCDPSDFVHFRKRIGEAGVEKIFAHSVALHGKDAKTKQMMSDTTVQGNNTTFPTDAKLAKQVIDRCREIAQREQIELRQSYKFVSKKLLRDSHNASHPKRRKKASKAKKKLRTIANRLLRELQRKLPSEQLAKHAQDLALFSKATNQQRHDKNKVYSLCKPFTACRAKGKAHQQYEFGNKAGLMTTTGKTIIITAIEAFMGNPYDGNTIKPLLEQSSRLHNHVPEELVYDRGGKVKGDKIDNTMISTPKTATKTRQWLRETQETQQVQTQSSNRSHDRTSKTRLPHGTKLPKLRKVIKNQRYAIGNGMESKETDGEIGETVFLPFITPAWDALA